MTLVRSQQMVQMRRSKFLAPFLIWARSRLLFSLTLTMSSSHSWICFYELFNNYNNILNIKSSRPPVPVILWPLVSTSMPFPVYVAAFTSSIVCKSHSEEDNKPKSLSPRIQARWGRFRILIFGSQTQFSPTYEYSNLLDPFIVLVLSTLIILHHMLWFCDEGRFRGGSTRDTCIPCPLIYSLRNREETDYSNINYKITITFIPVMKVSRNPDPRRSWLTYLLFTPPVLSPKRIIFFILNYHSHLFHHSFSFSRELYCYCLLLIIISLSCCYFGKHWLRFCVSCHFFAKEVNLAFDLHGIYFMYTVRLYNPLELGVHLVLYSNY